MNNPRFFHYNFLVFSMTKPIVTGKKLNFVEPSDAIKGTSPDRCYINCRKLRNRIANRIRRNKSKSQSGE